MRGRNLSSLAVIIILIVVSAYLSFSGNQTLAATLSGPCKAAGEKWDYDANQNLPPFDCCAELKACPDGYCCEAENEALPVTAQIIANPTEHSDEPPTFAAENDPVITEAPENPSETQSEQSEEPENNEPITTVSEKTDTTKLPATVYKKEYYVIDEGIEEEEPIQIFDPEPVEITCYRNSDCGGGGWVGNTYCKNGDVWQKWRTYTCHSPGTEFSYCSYSDKGMKKQDCSEGCGGGECSSTIIILGYVCYQDSDCGTDGWLGQEYCTSGGGENEDLADTYRTYTCHNPGTPSAYCTHTDTDMIKQDCGDTECGDWGNPFCYDGDVWHSRICTWRGCNAYGCYEGTGGDDEKLEECGSYTCTNGECDFDCYEDSDCGADGWIGNPYCKDGDVYQEYRTYTCNNPGTINSECVHSDDEKKKEECGSKDCVNGECVENTNNPPSIDSYSPATDPTINIGQSQAFSITKSDPDNDPLTVKWYVDNVLKKQNSDSYTYTANTAGTYEVKVTVSDGTDSVNHKWTLTVNQGGNNPPSIDSYSPATDPTINVGQSQAFSITKSDPDGDTLTVKWFVDNTLKKQGSDSYTYTATTAGTYKIKVTVSDGTDTVYHEWTLTVNQEEGQKPDLKASNLRVMWPPNPEADEIVSFEFKIKNIGNKKAENIKFKLLTGESNWNPSNPINLDVGEEIYIAYDHTYSDPGTYTVTAIADPNNQISESNENNNQMSITITVS